MADQKNLIANNNQLNSYIDITISDLSNNLDDDKILCLHCGRSSDNGIRCIGRCVEDNED